MGLAEARTELAGALRTQMGWTGEIASEYETFNSLPVIVLLAGDSGGSEDLAGDEYLYALTAEVRLDIGDTDGVERHRDPSNSTGLAGALHSLEETGMMHSTVIPQTISSDVAIVEYEDGSTRAEYLEVSVGCDWYV